MQTKDNILRRVRLAPYRKGCGPTFALTIWDTGCLHRGGPQYAIGYRLTMHEAGKRTVLFQGEDFGCSPMHAIDSDACVESLMVFLTLRPGDTDREYFADYTPAQIDYCEQHAEALGVECTDRFGE